MIRILRILSLLLVIFSKELVCQILQPAFFIRKNSEKITFFKINIKPSIIETNTIIRLYEAQIFMPDTLDCQAIALLNDTSFVTTGIDLYHSICYGVCINPNTEYRLEKLRYNPGPEVILFDIFNNPKNKNDWHRAQAAFKRKDKNSFPIITAYWEIPPKDTSNSLKIPLRFKVSSLEIARKLAMEELGRFKDKPDESLIRKNLNKRLGKRRTDDLYFARLEYVRSTEDHFIFIAVFRLW